MTGGLSYRGEGNANLVLSLTGTRAVLRLPKSKFVEKSQQEKLEAMKRYSNTVMLPALREYVAPVDIVHLTVDQLTAIRSSVWCERPEARRAKNVYYPGGLLMRDYCVLAQEGLGPVLAVEIKPKKGFVSGNTEKIAVCEFCVKQREKVRAGQVKAESSYCPLDLFSGDTKRMKAALNNLAHNPQNNLRIFQDGNLLHDEDSANTAACGAVITEMFGNKFCLAEVLVHLLCQPEPTDIVLSKSSSACDNLKSKPSTCDKSKSNLPPNSILNKILALQKISSLTEVEAEEVVDGLVTGGLTMSDILSAATGGDSVTSVSDQQAETIQTLRRYLVSRTARDLSIILTIQEERPGASNNMDRRIRVSNRVYKYNLSVIDLDPKKLKRISESDNFP